MEGHVEDHHGRSKISEHGNRKTANRPGRNCGTVSTDRTQRELENSW